MTIDFRRFSLGKTKIEIQRFIGEYPDGSSVFVRTLNQTIDAWASVQPYDTVEPEQIFEPMTGQWVNEVYWMFIDQVVYQNNNQDITNPVADLILVDSVLYRPIRVQKWLHLSNEHYKVLLQRYDGD